MNSLKTKAVPAALTLIGLMAFGTANAGLIDFTAPRWGNGLSGSQITKGVPDLGRVTLKAAGGDLSAKPGPSAASTPRSGGIGIGGDGEISGKERLNVKFSKATTVAGLNFQGLAKKNERVVVKFFKDGVLVATKIVSGSDLNGGKVGVNFDGILADKLVIRMAPGSVKNNPNAGGSLAGISVVPIPAAAWLFGSALLGLAGVGYRRKPKA